MSNDSDEPKAKRSGGAVVVLLAIVAVVSPVVYTASVGPASWMVKYGYLSESVYTVFYYPLILVCQRFPGVQSAVEAYSRWFL